MDNGDFITAQSGVDLDEIAKQDERPYHNVILVGTKLDLVKQNPALRRVSFQEAKNFSRRLGLAACLEISSKEEEETEAKLTDVSQCFLMSALISFENQLIEQKRAKLMALRTVNASSIGQHTLYPAGGVGQLGPRAIIHSDAGDEKYNVVDNINFKNEAGLTTNKRELRPDYVKHVEGKGGRIYKYDGTSTIWNNEFKLIDEPSENGGTTSTGPKATPDGGDALDVSGFEAVDNE